MAQDNPEKQQDTAAGAGALHYHDLQKMTVVRLREMAQEYNDLEGVTGMSKEKLVDVLARKKGIEIPHKVVVGVDKASIKARMRELKKARGAALEAKDYEQLRRTRRKMHRLRHHLRRSSTVAS
jgi:hypothetical protein